MVETFRARLMPGMARLVIQRINDERAAVRLAMSVDHRRVYFIQAGDGGAIKIGISHDVKQRLCGLQAANPARLILLGTMPGGRIMELALHNRFRHSRIHGEWFHPNPFLAHFVGELTEAGALR